MPRWEEMTPDQKCDQLREEIHEVRIVVNGTANNLDELTSGMAVVVAALQKIAEQQRSEASTSAARDESRDEASAVLAAAP
jgi:hypothetical protein